MTKTKVLIVDDSAVVRQVLSSILNKDPSLEVIGAVVDPILAMKRMEMDWPDVIVLDIEMPRMDGITFLTQIMQQRPTPVVICSTLTEKGTETAMQAMAAGAVDIVTKPKIGLKDFFEEEASMLVQAVKGAAKGRLMAMRQLAAKRAGTMRPAPVLKTAPSREGAMARTTQGVVAIGTSTGGTQALELVLSSLPLGAPGIVVVQHMPEKFTAAFAQRLDSLCELEVMEAKDGDHVIPGRVLIAPGGRHMRLQRSGARYCVEVFDGPQVNRHRPSVDVLFRSVTKVAGQNALGVIMTGMGDDGAHAMKEMHDRGIHTIAQNEETCVVYGMPAEAVKLQAVDDIVPLDDISSHIMRFGSRHGVL
ncbi:MAG: chemotaxis response regulator protein-glutamate methylesterase [Gammaproteobacteria bacterium]|nr:chemotaxis response regulator protein-glutamate methylesterase [Gammaproteobacteria bacterium]